MKKKLVGFYRELAHGFPSAPSLREVIADLPLQNEAEIVAYLRNGAVLSLTMGPEQDVLSPEPKLISPSHVLTDGLWIWPLDLAYYVEHYHARLPEEFIDRMRSLHWAPPTGNDLLFALPSPSDCEIL